MDTIAAPAGIKLDDGTGYFVSKCFPARSILGGSDDGAWLVAQRIEQKRRLKAVLGTKESKTYSQIKHERRLRENPEEEQDDSLVTPGLLDGFFLLQHCCVDDPSDLCNINIVAQDLTDAREEDFDLFQNVAFINAGENLLHFEWFRGFRNLHHLEIPLNGLRGLQVSLADFPSLQILDLSYNNLSKADILGLGVLPKLRVLHLSGNQLRSLPLEMQKPHQVQASESENALVPRFALLEELSLDDNQLSDLTTFASLAGLRRLKRLNLEKNLIQAVPHLKAVSGSHIAIDSETNSASSTPRKHRSKSGKSRSQTPDSTPSKSKKFATDSQSQLNELEESLRNDLSLDSDVFDGGKLGDGGEDEELESLPPPFPELEYLNLAHNEVVYEENLLAVAAWPMLNQLDIYANPLTIHNKGDPPLLKQYLVDRLGIRMRRQRPISAGKPPIQVSQTSNRKAREEVKCRAIVATSSAKMGALYKIWQVAELARPLPKRPLQLMLEPSPSKPAVLPPEDDTPPQSVRPASQPLPPISPSVDMRQKTQTAPAQMLREGQGPLSSKVPSSPDSGRKEEEKSDAEEPVFLTQVDDQDEERSSQEIHPPPAAARPRRVDSAKYSAGVPEKFKGYEVFWEAPNDPEVVVQNDIQSNLRSLKLALEHKPVYRSNVDLDRLQKPFEPHEKAKFQPRPPHKTKAEKLEEVLQEIKNRVTVSEENLGKILEDKEKMKSEYPEVPALLKEIQMKYKAVRAESMMERRQIEDVKDDLVQTAGELQASVKTPLSKATTSR